MFAYCSNSPVMWYDPTGYTEITNKDNEDNGVPFDDLGPANTGPSSGKGIYGGNSSSKGARGVGGKGWVGDKTWRENVSTVGQGGTITSLNGGVPTQDQAWQLIYESGGTSLRIDGPHQFPNPHNYPHINYLTNAGIKGTIKIFK